MFSKREKSLPIGMDLGHGSIKLLQMTSTPRGPAVVAVAKETLGDDITGSDRRFLSLQAASRLLDRNKFSGRRVLASLPREIVQLKNIRIPLMPAAEIASAVAFEAANVFDFDLTTAVLKHIVAGEIRQGSESRLEIMCVAVQNAEIDLFVEQTQQAGLELAGLEFEPACLFSAMARFSTPLPPQSAQLMVDVGYRRSQVLIGRDGDLQFFKPIDIGSRRLIAAVARKLGISEKEAAALRSQLDASGSVDGIDDSVRNAVEDSTRQLITELSREVALCFRHFSVTFRGVRVKQMQILGGEPNCTLLRKVLQQELPVPLHEPAQISFLNQKEGPLSVAPWCLAAALAARHLPKLLTNQAPAAPAWEPSLIGTEVAGG